MRDFTMMMKEDNFQIFLGNLVHYRSKEGSAEFNLRLIEMNKLIEIKEETA